LATSVEAAGCDDVVRVGHVVCSCVCGVSRRRRQDTYIEGRGKHFLFRLFAQVDESVAFRHYPLKRVLSLIQRDLLLRVAQHLLPSSLKRF
jgi:hypothetical protein